MQYAPTIREEELKNRVAADLFPSFDCTAILGNVDFCVRPPTGGSGSVRAADATKRVPPAEQLTLWETESLLWAEAKNGVRADFAPLFAQLVLTVGGERTYEKHSPPPFLGAFDCEKIAFVPWHAVLDLFFRPDIDWTATPSNAESPAFAHVLSLLRPLLDANLVSFRFGDPDLPKFIRKNLFVGNDRANRLQVTRNNFPFVYQKWVRAVKPSIAVNWEAAKRQGIHDADFFLADLLSKDNATLMEKLFVVLRGNHYLADRQLDPSGLLLEKRVDFNDGQKAHAQFWNQYRRPPRRAFWDFINERRDLLMPADIRERQGSFFTPQIWVEKAQEAIAAVLGEDWQDHYCVWDCAAGTGNLLAGLDPKAKYRVWASTLQKGDVDIMRERIRNGAALLDSHVFQFDFLNDPFDKLPDGLREIIQDPERRKKLVVFINPPYAEAGNKGQMTARGKNKSGVTFENATYEKYHTRIGTAARELAALFLTRIYCEIPGCIIGNFTKLKIIQSVNFKGFRDVFQPKLESLFVVPANTFDNVKGDFPIGFFVWNGALQERFSEISATVIQPSKQESEIVGQKMYCSYDSVKFMLHWIRQYFDKTGDLLAYLRVNGQDMQNRNGVFLTLSLTPNDIDNHFFFRITKSNVLQMSVYFAVRHCIEADWLNDRDQFLWPADSWKADREFQLDCLVFTLFHGQNRISCRSADGSSASGANAGGPPALRQNHWIPFFEDEVGARDCMKSHFMAEFLKKCANVGMLPKTSANAQLELATLETGNIGNWQRSPDDGFLFAAEETGMTRSVASVPTASDLSTSQPLTLSTAATGVMDASRRLWRHYHAQPGALPDASFYDIRAHFQGFKPNGHMNPDSPDATYTALLADLRAAMKVLAAQITPKVHEHGFLK